MMLGWGKAVATSVARIVPRQDASMMKGFTSLHSMTNLATTTPHLANDSVIFPKPTTSRLGGRTTIRKPADTRLGGAHYPNPNPKQSIPEPKSNMLPLPFHQSVGLTAATDDSHCHSVHRHLRASTATNDQRNSNKSLMLSRASHARHFKTQPLPQPPIKPPTRLREIHVLRLLSSKHTSNSLALHMNSRIPSFLINIRRNFLDVYMEFR